MPRLRSATRSSDSVANTPNPPCAQNPPDSLGDLAMLAGVAQTALQELQKEVAATRPRAPIPVSVSIPSEVAPKEAPSAARTGTAQSSFTQNAPSTGLPVGNPFSNPMPPPFAGSSAPYPFTAPLSTMGGLSGFLSMGLQHQGQNSSWLTGTPSPAIPVFYLH
jgi:hypothetical protein